MHGNCINFCIFMFTLLIFYGMTSSSRLHDDKNRQSYGMSSRFEDLFPRLMSPSLAVL